MRSFLIDLPTLEDVRRFCTAANRCPCKIEVVSDPYVVNAKSIMALFTLDWDKPVKVEFHGTDSQYEELCRELGGLAPKES